MAPEKRACKWGQFCLKLISTVDRVAAGRRAGARVGANARRKLLAGARGLDHEAPPARRLREPRPPPA
eukprot:5704594-Pyramimonas_sp.AAC.1